jgi:hypothetical protein
MMGLARRATTKTRLQMAFRDFQLCEDETKNGINVFEHNTILSLNSKFFGVHPDFADKEIQSHPSR